MLLNSFVFVLSVTTGCFIILRSQSFVMFHFVAEHLFHTKTNLFRQSRMMEQSSRLRKVNSTGLGNFCRCFTMLLDNNFPGRVFLKGELSEYLRAHLHCCCVLILNEGFHFFAWLNNSCIVHLCLSNREGFSTFPPYLTVSRDKADLGPVHADLVNVPKGAYNEHNRQPGYPTAPVDLAKFVHFGEVRVRGLEPHH